MVKSIYSLFLVIFLFGCVSKEKKGQASALADGIAEVSKTTNTVENLPIYDFDGLEPMLYRTDDKTYVINFWATWCAPCVKELPYFEKINAEQKNNNVEVILVSLDMPKMWESHLIPFINEKGLESQVVVLDDPDQNTWIPKVDKNWSGAIPATIIYNKDKRSFYEQSFTYDELNDHLHKFISD